MSHLSTGRTSEGRETGGLANVLICSSEAFRPYVW